MIDFQYNFNTLDIPSLMGPYVVVVSGIAGGLVPVLFTIEMVNEHTRALFSTDNKAPRLIRIIARTLIISLASLFLYQWVFLKIVAICEAIGFAMYKGQDWGVFVERFAKTQQGEISLLDLNISAFGAAFFGLVLNIIEDVFMMVRFVVLAVLYVIGPLAIVGGISKITRGYTGGWFKLVFQVSFWVVLFRALQGVLLALNAQVGGAWYQSLSAPVINGIVILSFSATVPHFTQALLSSGYIESIAGGAVSALQNSGINSLKKIGELFPDQKPPPDPPPPPDPRPNPNVPTQPNPGGDSKVPANKPKVR